MCAYIFKVIKKNSLYRPIKLNYYFIRIWPNVYWLTNQKLGISLCSLNTLTHDNNSEVDKNNVEAEFSIKCNSKDPIILKYTQMVAKLSENNADNVEKIYKTDFGSIRFDSDNPLPLSHSYLKSNKASDEIDLDSSSQKNYLRKSFDDMELKNISNYSAAGDGKVKTNSTDFSQPDQHFVDLNYVDSQYFESNMKDNNNGNGDTQSFNENNSLEFSKMNLDYIDKQYFYQPSKSDSEHICDINTTNFVKNSPNLSKNIDFSTQNSYLTDKPNERKIIPEEPSGVYSFEQSLLEESEANFDSESNVTAVNTRNVDISILEEKLLSLSQNINEKIERKSKKFGESKDEVVNKVDKISKSGQSVKSETKSGQSVKSETTEAAETKQQTAYDFVLHKRREENKPTENNDSLPLVRYKKILSEVPNFSFLTQHDMVMVLKNSILYDNHDIVAIYKPYGVALHGGGESKEKRFNIVDLLPQLANILKVGHLEAVHRIDVNTTGILLLSKTESTASKLKKMFKEHKIHKTYLAITKGSIDPLIGLIDIPVAEGTVDNRNRMVLRPDIPGFRGRPGTSKQAITKYKVLSRTTNASLVELNPITGIKHQLRVHLGFGLACPVLGDHKYSHLTKMVPQRLPSDMLHQLDIKQSRVRDLPMYLHAFAISIPDFDEGGRNIIIRAGPPKFFKSTLRNLQLTKRQNRIDEKFSEIIY